MKKIYKTLMTLAAALSLPLSLTAQTTYPKYSYDGIKHIGYNKYLLSNTPNDEGEYTLRIENFISGEVKVSAMPTDFVMVLDISGSMQEDYKTRGQTVPLYITKAQNDALSDKDMKKLRLDDGQGMGYSHYAYTGYYSGGAVGSTGSGTYGSYGSITWAYEAANPIQTGVPHTNRWFYFEEDQTFYRIFRWHETISGTNCMYVYFDRTNGERRYLVMSGNDITTTTTKPTNLTYSTSRIVLVDNQNNSGYKLYRYGTRKDALQSGVNTFIDLIAAENAKDQWDEGVTKHQLAIVAFGDNNATANLNQATDPGGNTHKDGKTKVARIFREINENNKASYKNWDQYCNWNGYTHIYRGVDLGRRLLQDLQTKTDMYPVNTQNGAVNRKKVMIVFTDGEPTALTTNGNQHQTPVAGYSGNVGQSALSMEQGLIVKTQVKNEKGEIVNPNAINGVIYTINLSPNTTNVPDFLSRLSSNYPDGAMKLTTGTFATGTNYKTSTYFTGTLDPDGDYYKDANALNNLESIFESIFHDNTGDMSSTMVAVDVMTDDFVIDFQTSDKDKVKLYTAQCIGLTGDTIIDDQNNPHSELAFAQEVEVANRPPLQHLWVYKDNEWVDLGANNDIDIDNRVDFKIVGNSIILFGFNYGELWCGLDETPAHNNTRQIEDTDPNFDKQLPGYRGFKVIFEFPIKLSPDALGGINVPTNDVAHSGLFKGNNDGDPVGTTPEVNYPTPNLPVPVRLVIQKTGLTPGESANFTIQRRTRVEGSTWTDFTTFVLTGEANSTPEVRIINLDPNYYYKVKEENWSWAYTNVHPEYSTDDPTVKNPIVFENDPIPTPPPHAEAKATNKMTTWEGQSSSTETVNSK